MCHQTAALAAIKELAGHSEVKAGAQLDPWPSELQPPLTSRPDGLPDVAGGKIALFKLAALETRKRSDDVEAIAGVWKALAELYDRRLARVEEAFP